MFARTAADQALWAALMADPESDAPRLVYADALQHRGEALGEFISLQCHPNLLVERTLWERANELERLHMTRWKAEVGVPTARLWFQRGLPIGAEVTLAADALGILERAPIRTLVFRAPQEAAAAPALETMQVIARDPRLARVFASQTYGGVEVTRALIGSPYFVARSLDVMPYSATNETAEALRTTALPHLTGLRFFSNGWYRDRPMINDVGVAALTRGTWPLRHLELNDLPLTAASLHSLARSDLVLESLRLKLVGDVADGLRAFVTSPAASRLVKLDLSSGELDDRALAALVEGPLPSLRELNLALNSRLTGPGLEALANSSTLPRLESLNLSHTTLSPASCAVFAASPRLAQLHTLSLEAASKGPAMAIAIAHSPHATRLRSLNLSGCKGRDEAAFEVARSESLSDVERLSFYRNKVTHAGREVLQARFGERLSID